MSENERGTLVISGSYAPYARAEVERLAEQGALVLTLNRQAVLTQDESYLMGLRSGAAAAIKQGRDVVVRSENWPEAAEVVRRLGARRGIPMEELEARVREMLARVALGAVQSAGAARLVVLGRETGAAVCRALGVEPGAPGEVVRGPGALVLVVLAGSAGAPGAVVEAVARLEQVVGGEP